MDIKSGLEIGFEYVVEHERNGVVIGTESVHNLITNEGITHATDVVLVAGSQILNWYMGIYEGDYTPVATVTAATLPAAATECTAYDEVSRRGWLPTPVDTGATTNWDITDNRAVYTMNATKTVYGGFFTSASAKGSTAGTLFSVVRFATVKNVEAGDILRLKASFISLSAT